MLHSSLLLQINCLHISQLYGIFKCFISISPWCSILRLLSSCKTINFHHLHIILQINGIHQLIKNIVAIGWSACLSIFSRSTLRTEFSRSQQINFTNVRAAHKTRLMPGFAFQNQQKPTGSRANKILGALICNS